MNIEKVMKRPEIEDPELNELFKKLEKQEEQRKIGQDIAEKKRKERSDKMKVARSKHIELVEIGRKWLTNNTPTKGNIVCGIPSIVITEIATETSETPDIIAFAGSSSSILLEAKTSRQDFKADAKKSFRSYSAGLGNFRCYIAPEGLIKVDELPENWGLIEVDEKGKCKKTKYPEKFQDEEVNKRGEMGILLSVIKRIGRNAPDGVSIKCYTHETKNTATLTTV